MRIAREDIPVRIDVPGATARQQMDFGDVSGYGRMGAEYFSFGAGTDITELLHGLEGDACQSPHWGYVVGGRITAIYRDGEEETSVTGDLFYWPPGHSVRAEEDTDIVMFSPQEEHGRVLDHVLNKLGG
ncbi:cupin domain-containing protein [Thiohalobacter thiocyanaticus]|uniref:Cupin domain-containing protein n=1 Tax=Thiohalobacter thiocyanaticus TaxID=585455 RepID=A0A426QGD3_9GAMM|nr:cupin domain-containing protein [Thiohalobacter thiocyanaticus]RRQ20790.1 cupin domain-containing protein [Thiohalobacter thiocyanaticus]